MKVKSFIFAILAIGLIACNKEPEIVTPTDPEVSNIGIYLSKSYRWEVEKTVEDGDLNTASIEIGRDTVINQQTYHLVNDYYPLRQDQSRIYMYDYVTKEEVLLYDFSLQVGDVIKQLAEPFGAYPERDAKVIKVDTITLADGRKARRLEYEQTFPAPRGIDIEYVGKATGGILGVLDNSMRESHLVAFYDGETLLYP